MSKIFYTTKVVNELRLKKEMNDSEYISVKCLDVAFIDASFNIIFANDLSTEEETVMRGIIDTHVATPLDTADIQIVSVVENTNVSDIVLNFKIRPLLYHIPAGVGLHQLWYATPYPILLLGSTLDCHTDMIGDSFKLELIADTAVGQLTQKAYRGQNSLFITPGADKFIYPGYLLGPEINTDPEPTSSIITWGEVIKVVSNRIYLDNTLTEDYDEGTPIIMNYAIVEKKKIQIPGTYWIARDVSRGARIPAGQSMKLSYWNANGVEKDIQLDIAFYL